MISAFKNIWSIPELRMRVLFTFAMLAVYRIGSHIPTPGIDPAASPASNFQCKTNLIAYFHVSK